MIPVNNLMDNFTLIKILKDVPILTSYTPLDASTSNLDLPFKIDNINFI
jgi:hypothetical protein